MDQDGFEVRHINKTIGKGVFTTKEFAAGDFLLEYVGTKLTAKEAAEREDDYKKQKKKRCYMYHYREDGKAFV